MDRRAAPRGAGHVTTTTAQSTTSPHLLQVRPVFPPFYPNLRLQVVVELAPGPLAIDLIPGPGLQGAVVQRLQPDDATLGGERRQALLLAGVRPEMLLCAVDAVDVRRMAFAKVSTPWGADAGA